MAADGKRTRDGESDERGSEPGVHERVDSQPPAGSTVEAPEAPEEAPPSSSAADPRIGTTIEPYRVVRLIGRGGMGAVYEGLNTRIQKRVALKFIDARLAASPDAVQRFQREAQAASAVESPNIVQIFDAGATEDGIPFLVMELLNGCDLGRHLREVGRLALEPALQLTAQVLKALGEAHQAGIVHRDLKPDNVFLVERDGEVAVIKLLDFGVSKIAGRDGVQLETLTKEGTVVGTPHYMSPEQAQGLADVDATTDIYSTGAILYECLTGRTPHVGRSYEQVIVRICTSDASDVRELAPDVPAPVAAVVARALARNRADRFASTSEMLSALLDASPASLRDKMQSGVFTLASSGSGSYGRASSSGGSSASGSSRSSKPMTPTEADAVGSASTVAAPIVSSGVPPRARSGSDLRGRASGAGLSSTGERSAPPSTVPTYQPPGRARRWLWAVVLAGVLGGVVATLAATKSLHISFGSADGASPGATGTPSAAREPAPSGESSSVPAGATEDAPLDTEDAGGSGSSSGPPPTAEPDRAAPPKHGSPSGASAPVATREPSTAPAASPSPSAPSAAPPPSATGAPKSTGMDIWRDPSLP